jgi:hypothetical protein
MVDVTDPLQAQPLLNMLNVRYMLAPPNLQISEGLPYRLVQRLDLAVVENLQAWPRAFFCDSIISYQQTAGMMAELKKRGASPFIAMEKHDLDSQAKLQSLVGTELSHFVPAEHYKLGVNSTHFELDAPSPGVVCLAEGNAVGCRATVDGVNAEIFPMNHLFKGVYIPRKGHYRIEFSYRPPLWSVSLMCFSVATVVLATWASLSIWCAWRLRHSTG